MVLLFILLIAVHMGASLLKENNFPKEEKIMTGDLAKLPKIAICSFLDTWGAVAAGVFAGFLST